MSSSVAPRFPKTSVFIPAYWENARGELLTQDEADARYLKFPIGQGTESIPNLIVAGTSTLGITSATTLSLTDTTGASLTAGNQTSSTGNTNFGGNGEISRLTATAGTNQSLTIYSRNTTGNTPQSTLILNSGNNASNPSLELKSVMLTESSVLSINNDALDLYTLLQADEDDARGGVLTYKSANSVPISVLYSNTNVYVPTNNNFVGVRCNQDGAGTIEFFQGSTISATANIGSFSPTATTITATETATTNIQQLNLTSTYCELRVDNTTNNVISFFRIGYNFMNWAVNDLDVMNINASSDRIELRRNMRQDTTSNGDTCGILETGIVNATTTGTTTLTFATSAFRTTINTPSSAGRVFVLPTPTSANAGYWIAICNKSTANLISVQYPAGTTIFNIPVALNATNGGSSAKFAVQLLTPFTYFRVA